MSYTKDLRPLTPNEQAIHDAIGYDPVRVSMPGGIGGLTYRTADDMDNLIAKLAPLLDAKDATISALDDGWNMMHYTCDNDDHAKAYQIQAKALGYAVVRKDWE